MPNQNGSPKGTGRVSQTNPPQEETIFPLKNIRILGGSLIEDVVNKQLLTLLLESEYFVCLYNIKKDDCNELNFVTHYRVVTVELIGKLYYHSEYLYSPTEKELVFMTRSETEIGL